MITWPRGHCPEKRLTISIQGDSGNTKKVPQRLATLEVVDCVSCGQSIHHSKLAKHLESCYTKVENTHAVVAKELTYDEDGTNIVCCDFYDARTKTYCKKLKASCPLHAEHFVRGFFCVFSLSCSH